MSGLEGCDGETPDVVLYGGKGGVGKTTFAAAHGLEALASLGPRLLSGTGS